MGENFIPVVIDAAAFISAQYKQVFAGIKAAAGKAGYGIRVFHEDGFDALDTAAWPPVIIAGGTSLPFLHQVIRRMDAEGRRVVLAGTDAEQFGPHVSCTTHSRQAEMLQVLSYLQHCGRTRIALVGFNKRSINEHHRYRAALNAPHALGLPLTRRDAFTWDQDPEACFRDFLGHAADYDAVVCPNDVMAVSFTRFCQVHDLSVPDDLFVASFGSMELSRWSRPSITTTRMDDHEVGQQTFTVWHLLREQRTPGAAIKLSLPSYIIPRESTSCLPDAEALHTALPQEQADVFYSVPMIAALVRLDDCLSRRDELDMKILQHLLADASYEDMADALFLSASSLKYRLHKIFADAGVSSRAEFEAMVRTHLGTDAPFAP